MSSDIFKCFALERKASKAKHLRSVLRPDFVDILQFLSLDHLVKRRKYIYRAGNPTILSSMLYIGFFHPPLVFLMSASL